MTVVVFREGESWYVDTAGVKRTFHPTDPPGSNEYVPAEGRAHNIPVQEVQVPEKPKRREKRGVRQIAAPAPKPKPAPKKQAPAPQPVPATKREPVRSTRQPSRAAQAAPAPKSAGTTVAVAERKTVATQPVKLGSLKPKQQMWLDLTSVEWGLDPAKQSVKVKITGNGFHHLLAYHEPGEGRLPVKKERGSVWVLTDIGKRKPAWLPVGPG